MSNEIKAAIIGATAVIVAALITVIFGPFIARAINPPVPTPIPPYITSIPNTPPSTPVSIISPTQTQSMPIQTMHAFCSDLYNQRYSDAYSLFSKQLQNQIQEDYFASSHNQATCGQNNGFTGSNDGVQTTSQILYPNGFIYDCVFDLTLQNNNWLINDERCSRVR